MIKIQEQFLCRSRGRMTFCSPRSRWIMNHRSLILLGIDNWHFAVCYPCELWIIDHRSWGPFHTNRTWSCSSEIPVTDIIPRAYRIHLCDTYCYETDTLLQDTPQEQISFKLLLVLPDPANALDIWHTTWVSKTG